MNEEEVLLKIKSQFDGAGVDAASGALGKFGGAAMGISKGVGAGVLAGGAAFAGFSAMAIKSASDIGESQNKVNVVFGESAKAIDDMAATASTKLGMTKGEVLSAAGGIGNLLTAMGQSKEKAAEMSVGMVQLATDLGSFNNASSTEVLEAMQAAMAGETDGMKKYGVAINEATLKQAAMEEGLGENVQALSAAEKQMLTMKIMMEQTGAAQGDFERTSGGLANATKSIKAGLSDVVGEIGAGLLPSVEKAAGAFAGFLKSDKFDEFKQKVIDAFAAIGERLASIDFAAVADTIAGVFQKVGDVITWIGDNPGIAKFVAGALGIIAAIAPLAAILGPIIGLFTTLMPIIAGIGAVLSGPVVLAVLAVIGAFVLWKTKGDEIMAAVQAFVAGIGLAWENLKAATIAKWEEIRATIAAAWQAAVGFVLGKLAEMKDAIRLQWDAMLRNIQDKLDAILTGITTAWNNVKDAIDTAMQAVSGLIDAAWDAIWLIVDGALTTIKDGIDKALGFIETITGTSLDDVQRLWSGAMDAVKLVVGAVIAFLKGDWEGALNGMKAAVETAVTAVVGFFTAMKDNILRAIGNAKEWLKGVGEDIVAGIKEGIAGSWEALKRFIQDQIGDLIALAKRILGISSPSKVFQEIGENIVKGLLIGIKTQESKASGAIAIVVDKMLAVIKTSESKFTGAGIFLGLKFADGIGLGFQRGKSVIATLLNATIDAMMVDASRRIAENIRTFGHNALGDDSGGRSGGLDFGGKGQMARDQMARSRRGNPSRGADDEAYWANNAYGDSRHSHAARLAYLASQGRQFYDPPLKPIESPAGGRAAKAAAPIIIGPIKLGNVSVNIDGKKIAGAVVDAVIEQKVTLERLQKALTASAQRGTTMSGATP